MEWYVLEDGTKTWVHELEDGEWELDLLTWTKTSSDQGTIQLGIPSDYLSMVKTFSSSSAGGCFASATIVTLSATTPTNLPLCST